MTRTWTKLPFEMTDDPDVVVAILAAAGLEEQNELNVAAGNNEWLVGSDPLGWQTQLTPAARARIWELTPEYMAYWSRAIKYVRDATGELSAQLYYGVIDFATFKRERNLLQAQGRMVKALWLPTYPTRVWQDGALDTDTATGVQPPPNAP